MRSLTADVIVLGAGMAGLTAARALCEHRLRVLVVEARERVGGRVWSQPIGDDQVVELGAEFVHGRPPELWKLINEAGLKTTERDGAMLRALRPGVVAEDDNREDELFSPLEQLESYSGDDMPFADWLQTADVPEEEKPALIGYVEGFNAADAKRIGIRALGVQQKAEAEIEGDRAWHIRGGYGQTAEFLAARVRELGGEIRLNCEVKAVRWQAGAVEVETTQGILRAPKCVITLPLGVLQRMNAPGGITVRPEPAPLIAARRLAMGEVVRFTLVFREPWWERSSAIKDRDVLRRLSFLFTLRGVPSVWWTPHPEKEPLPTLTGWIGGPRSRPLHGKSAEELGEMACRDLAEVFGMAADEVRTALVSVQTHDWNTDAFARGAYSYVPAGAADAPAAMTQPEQDTLFFAGEHTDTTGNWGTVHAAMRSGSRAAEQVLGDKR